MTIANYANLQTSVANWLHRSDLTSIIPDLISLAETKLNRRLRLRAQVDTVTGTVSSSVALPTDFAELISLTVTNSGSTYPISYKKPSEITGESSDTFFYTIIGDNIVFEPVGSSLTYTLTYYAKFPALSAGVNWLITNAPDIYLYSSLLEAAPYLKDDSRVQTWATLLDSAITDIVRADSKDKYGDNLRVTAG